jgi:hypothetical protein
VIRARRLLLAVGLWLTSVGVAGCPPKETLIEITPSGAATLLNSCAGSELDVTGLCAGITDTCSQASGASAEVQMACNQARQQCLDLLAAQRDATCLVDGVARPPNPTALDSLALRLVLVTIDDGPVARDASACVPLSFDCGGEIREGCGAEGANRAIAEAISEEGLGFDGLDEPEDATPVLLLFHDPMAGDGEVTCTTNHLFACGALDQRIPGEDDYDIVCAACQGGPAPLVESAPCFGDCFLGPCAAINDQIQ